MSDYVKKTLIFGSEYTINVYNMTFMVYSEPKKGSLFDIVGTYSSGVKMTLKTRIAPMETTRLNET